MKTLTKINLLIIAIIMSLFSSSALADRSVDNSITEEVKARLSREADIPSNHIEVLTQNGVVSLKGILDTHMQAQRAIEIASSVDRVIDVVDSQLKVKGSDSLLSDSIITAKIKGKIRHLYNQGKIAEDYDIHVETTNGVTHLMGSVSRKIDLDTVVNAAKSVKGVKSVKHNIKTN